jgi:hypothetical protein
MPAEHMAQSIGITGERMIEWHNGAAGNTKEAVDLLADERLAHYLSAC